MIDSRELRGVRPAHPLRRGLRCAQIRELRLEFLEPLHVGVVVRVAASRLVEDVVAVLVVVDLLAQQRVFLARLDGGFAYLGHVPKVSSGYDTSTGSTRSRPM